MFRSVPWRAGLASVILLAWLVVHNLPVPHLQAFALFVFVILLSFGLGWLTGPLFASHPPSKRMLRLPHPQNLS